MKSREIRKFRKTYTDYKKKCVFEGYKLAVLFDEKDIVKRMGGRWDPEEMTWWMPAKNLKNDAEQYGGPPNGSLVEDYLNDMQMVMGQYGDIQKVDANRMGRYEQYTLRNGNKDSLTVNWFEDVDAVEFVSTSTIGKWFTVENARTHWDELVNGGYNRVENS
jgi:hypothetical protein